MCLIFSGKKKNKYTYQPLLLCLGACSLSWKFLQTSVFFPLQLSYLMFSCVVLTQCGFLLQFLLSKLTRVRNKYHVSKRKHYVPKCKSFSLIAVGCCEPTCAHSKWWMLSSLMPQKKKRWTCYNLWDVFHSKKAHCFLDEQNWNLSP